jgi:hypothetical protein
MVLVYVFRAAIWRHGFDKSLAQKAFGKCSLDNSRVTTMNNSASDFSDALRLVEILGNMASVDPIGTDQSLD